MTDEELKELQVRIDEMSVELDSIMHRVQERETEIDALWAQYWRIFGELTDEIKIDEMNALHKQKEEV